MLCKLGPGTVLIIYVVFISKVVFFCKVILMFEVVFIFEVIFIFEVVFIFEAVFIFKVVFLIYSISRPNLLFTVSKSDLKHLRWKFECGTAQPS